MIDEKNKTDAEWREQLNGEQYHVLRKHGTERAFSHPFNSHKDEGTYVCAGCGTDLFKSDAKFDSGTGWPSFFQPKTTDSVSEHTDRSFFIKRTEVRCAACDGHLGHVFPDGPAPTRQRYCMNGTAMKFRPKA